ncbi:uncharacterized protein LOC113347871 isoform X2 [Papaver somniferum]|uniref:uncharacterized protein LOC113347871 isoform X2 n=1 Tax=Papaver somniferum TaxID=3469 RepID=UPI000E6F97AE|nr:uncharacterized protein LOC113347871 isoform X2 [Papaver somniferum]
MAVTGTTGLILNLVSASWDTKPIKRIPNPTTIPNPSVKNPKAKSTTIKKKRELISTSELLKLNHTNPTNTKGKVDESHLGCERWLPSAPEVKKPRSIYNAASLAYLGDCIYELYARRHFLFPPLTVEEYNDRVMAVVRCEAQDALLKKLLSDDFLSVEERDILRWGRNIDTGKTKTTRRAGAAVYNRASSLETLVGHLYLTNAERLEEIMVRIGFTTVKFSGSTSGLGILVGSSRSAGTLPIVFGT